MCILVEALSCAREKGVGGGSLNDFKFGTSIGRFSIDGTAITAVKGLISFGGELAGL